MERLLDRALIPFQELLQLRRPFILFLHEVTDAAWFSGFIGGLASIRRVIGLPELLQRWEARSLEGREVAITFDDGYRSFLDCPHPILGERTVPSTLFVCSEVAAGGPAPWFARLGRIRGGHSLPALISAWRGRPRSFASWSEVNAFLASLHRCEALAFIQEAEDRLGIRPVGSSAEFLQRDELRRLCSDPLVTLAPHSHSHPILSRLSEVEQADEIRRSTEFVAAITGMPPALFAYPSGRPMDFDARSVRCLRRAGIRWALTTVQRSLRPGDDPFRLPRIGASEGHSLGRIGMKSVGSWVSIDGVRSAWLRRRMMRLVGPPPAP